MKTLLLTFSLLFISLTHYSQEWEYLTNDTNQTAFSYVLPSDDGGHFALNNLGNFYYVIRYDANNEELWSSYVECQDDLWISSFIQGPDGHIYVEGEQYQTCYFNTDTLVGHHHFIARYDESTGAEFLHVMPINHGITEMFVNNDDNFTLFTTFGGWGANYTLINGDTVWTKTNKDAMIMTMNMNFQVLDTQRIWGTSTGYASFNEITPRTDGYDIYMSAYTSIYYNNDSLGNHPDYKNAHVRIDDDLDIISAERLKFIANGASLSSFQYTDDATYILMRQSAWGDTYFGSTQFPQNGNNQTWLIKLDANGDLDDSKLIATTANQYVTAQMILADNDSLYVLGQSNRHFSLDQGDFYTQQYAYNQFVFVADLSFNTAMLSTIADTIHGSQSSIYGAKLIDGSIYACGRFLDTVLINDESYDYNGAHGWFGKLNITATVDTTNDTTTNDTVTSIAQFASESIQLYPNPANQKITISSESGDLETLTIYNLAGKAVENIELNQAVITNINTNTLASGIYFLDIKSEDQHVQKKLIIRH